MRIYAVMAVMVAALLLLPQVSGGLKNNLSVEKPMVFRKISGLRRIISIIQAGDYLYVESGTYGSFSVIKIDLRTYTMKVIGEVYLLLCPYFYIMLAYKDDIYVLLGMLGENIDVYKLKWDDTYTLEHHYSYGIDLGKSLTPGKILVYVHKQGFSVCSYDLGEHRDRCLLLKKPPRYTRIFGDDENVYFFDEGNSKIVAYGYDGNIRWNITDHRLMDLVGSDENFVYAFLNKSLVAIHKSSGKVSWVRNEVAYSDKLSIYSDAIYVADANHSSLLKISGVDGNVVWMQNISVNSKVVKYWNYLIAHNESVMYFLDSFTGKVLWSFDKSYLGIREDNWNFSEVTAGNDRVCIAINDDSDGKGIIVIMGWNYDENVDLLLLLLFAVLAIIGSAPWTRQRENK